MVIVLLRTVFIYILLIAIMRLMGKRQLGELEVTDLVITLLLSELATFPITDKNTPILYAVVPVISLASFEIFSSALSLRFPKIKKMLSPKTAILIRKGEVDHAAMKKVRITVEELMCELRQKDVTDIADVQYAILESNGKISVIKKAAATPPSAQQLGMQPQEPGIMHIVFCDGVYADTTLRALGKDRSWAQTQMRKQGLSPERVFYMIVDDLDNVRIQRRQK